MDCHAPECPGIIELQGDSDAAIVKGLIAVVFILYDQMTPQDIVNFDVRPWFEKMALTQHLTPSRSQGLEAMIRAIAPKPLHLAKLKGQLSSGWLTLPDGQCLH